MGDHLGPVVEEPPEDLVLAQATEAPDEDLAQVPEAMALLGDQALLVLAQALALEAGLAPLERRD